MPLAITPTFSPWTHTSDDSYIYQLSLVLATATVSFWYIFILRDSILLVSYINQSDAINNVFIVVGVLLGFVWSCGYAVQGRFEPGFWRARACWWGGDNGRKYRHAAHPLALGAARSESELKRGPTSTTAVIRSSIKQLEWCFRYLYRAYRSWASS